MNELTVKKENEISTDTNNNYVIIFNDRSTLFISNEVADGIMKASGGNAKFFTVNGNMIAFNNIARLITAKEYYEQFPEARPEIPETPDYINNFRVDKSYLGKKKFVERALEIWERQLAEREGPGIGGLERLISWAKAKLEPPVNKEELLEKIRKKRENKNLANNLLGNTDK